MPNFSASSQRRWKRCVWSGLHQKGHLAAVWMSGSFRGAVRPLIRDPRHSSLKFTTSSRDHDSPPTPLASVLPLHPPRASGAQGQLCQKHAVSQPTNIVPGNSSQIDSNESHSHARTCFGHARARDLLRDRCHSSSQDVSKDAGSHGCSVAGASILSASLVTSSPLAEITSSITCVAYQVPAYQGEPGLCNSPSPLKIPSLDGKGHGHRNGLQEKGCQDRCCAKANRLSAIG